MISSKIIMKSIFAMFMVIAYNCNASSNVEEAFKENQIVRDILRVAPKKIVNVSYSSGVVVDLGNKLTPTQIKDMPKVTWDTEQGAYYTLTKFDPDVPSRNNPINAQLRHWLVGNIPGNDIGKGDELVQFIPTMPPKQSGYHRYIFLIYKRPNGIIEYNEPFISKTDSENKTNMSADELAKKYNLGYPEFGNLFQAQYDE